MSDEPRARRPSPPGGAGGAGLLAAGFALAFGALCAAIYQEPSPLGNVASAVIDRAPHFLVQAGISTFGTNDKLVLGIVVVAVVLLVGVALGRLAWRHRVLVPVVFGAFAVVGLLAAIERPDSNDVSAAVILLLAAGAGALLLSWMLHLLPAAPVVPATAGPGGADDDDGRPPAAGRRAEPIAPPASSRRAFLAVAAGTLLAGSASVALARVLVDRAAVAARRAVRLPRPSSPATAVPADAGFSVPGLTPLVTPNADFYRIDTAFVVPHVDPGPWRLKVDGMVDAPFELTFEELSAMPTEERYVTLTCVSNVVGGGLAGNARWLGVPLAGLLDRARPRSGAQQVIGRSVDGFTVGFPIEAVRDGRTALVAVGMNGEPLPFAHGFPARLVVEGLYGYVSATKWLTEIELTTWDGFDAYWVPRGWSKRAPIKTESRIDVPRAGAEVPAGRVVVAGVAWAQGRGIEAVQVRVDDGRWVDADLGVALSDATWRQWRADVDLRRGRHTLGVRAVDGTGNLQTAVVAPPEPDGATGYHTVGVTAT